jgi:proteasome lid subunit RPN8/RPN11
MASWTVTFLGTDQPRNYTNEYENHTNQSWQFAQVSPMTTLTLSQLERIFAYAREADPAECCGLIGGAENGRAKSIYSLRNVAANTNVSYEAAPEDLFAAQRQMRERSEKLLAIYHSHPRSAEPTPSKTDVRLAYYPQAVYLIIGLAGPQPAMRAFSILEREQRWEQVEYVIADE